MRASQLVRVARRAMHVYTSPYTLESKLDTPLTDAILKATAAYGSRTAIVDAYHPEQAISFKDFPRFVSHCNGALRKLG